LTNVLFLINVRRRTPGTYSKTVPINDFFSIKIMFFRSPHWKKYISRLKSIWQLKKYCIIRYLYQLRQEYRNMQKCTKKMPVLNPAYYFESNFYTLFRPFEFMSYIFIKAFKAIIYYFFKYIVSSIGKLHVIVTLTIM